MKKLTKGILLLIIVISLACITISKDAVITSAKEIDVTNDMTNDVTNYNYEQIKKYENIVFLGDSITDWYPIKEIYGDLPIVKSGIAGYQTTNILKNMNSMVYSYNPTKVFILIGTNDLQYEDDDEKQVAKNIQKIIENIKENRKNAKIYYQSIYPVNENLEGSGERYNEEIMEVNKMMKEYCEKNDVTYIDMYKELVDDEGNFSESFTEDGLHPNSLGYARISQVLLKYIYDKQ